MSDLVERVARQMCFHDPKQWHHYAGQATDAINMALDEAAKVIKVATVMVEIQRPGTGPFTRQDRAVDETREQLAAAVLALKGKADG